MTVSHAKTMTVGFAKSDAAKIAREAKRRGLTPQRYVKSLVRYNLEISRIARTQTFAQIVGPVPGDVAEEEIDRLVEKAKAEFHKRSRTKR